MIILEMENQASRILRITNLENLIDLDLIQIFRCLHPMLCPYVGKSDSIFITLIDRLYQECSYNITERAVVLIGCVGLGLQGPLRVAEHS